MRPTVHMRVAVSVAKGRETNCSYAGSGIRGEGPWRGDVRPTVHMRVAVSVAKGRETNCSYAGSGIRG